MINIFKKGTKQLKTDITTYVVSWWRRYGKFSDDEEKCYQAFTDFEEAVEFKNNIERANAFIGNTYHAKATITQQKSGLPIGE